MAWPPAVVGCVAGCGFCTCLNWASALVRAFECWANLGRGNLLIQLGGTASSRSNCS